MKVMALLNLKMIKTTLRLLTMMKKKTVSKDSNGDATLKDDTKKTGVVGNDLEKTVMNESNGDG